MSLNDISRKELLSLPVREWGLVTEYDSLLVLSSRKKHDSGWACIVVVGVNDNKPVEIATMCSDDICWQVIAQSKSSVADFRTDCAFRSGAIHYWGRGLRFRVHEAISSIDIEIFSKGFEDSK